MAQDFTEEAANGTVLILELFKAIRNGQDNIPPNVHNLLGNLFTGHLSLVRKWMEKEGLNEKQFQMLLWKSKKGMATQIAAIGAALSTSCGKAFHQTKESADAATDTNDLVETASVATMSLPIESVPCPNSDENGDHESSDDDDDDDDDGETSYNGGGGSISLLSDSTHASGAVESDGLRRSTRQRPAPQAPPPSPPPKPKKNKSRKKKTKTKTKKLTVDKDTGAEKTTGDGADEEEAACVGRDLAKLLEQLEFSLDDIQDVENVIEELQLKLDELGETDGGGQDGPPQYIADEIALIKMVVEVLKQFRRGDITIDELKQSIADFFTFIEPYQEVVEQLLVLENKTTDDLKSEQSFKVRGKTLGEALKNTEKDSSSPKDEELDQTEELEYARGVVNNAQEATGTSCKTSLLECLRLKNTLRNSIRFLLNFRVAIDVLERGTIADFLTTKKDKRTATKLAKEVGALDCASTDCNAMKFFSKVIFQCGEDNSSAKVELILAFAKGMKATKGNEKLMDLYRKAAALDITTGEYKGESNYFDGKEGQGRSNLPSMTFMIAVLGDDIDAQLIKVGLVPKALDFTASVFGSSIRTMEKTVGFVAKPKFWTGNFDAIRANKFDAYKLTKGDVLGKLEEICKRADETMDDYKRKYMLMHVNNSFVEALVRFRDTICAKRRAKY